MRKYLFFVRQALFELWSDYYWNLDIFSKFGIWIWRTVMLYVIIIFSVCFIVLSPIIFFSFNDIGAYYNSNESVESKEISCKIILWIENILDKRTTKKLTKRLYSIPKDTWLEVGHTMNRWEFPMKFYDIMPRWWILEWDKRRHDRAYKMISTILDIIDIEFGIKEVLRYHNVEKGEMTAEEFEFWYSIKSSENKARLYYDKIENFRQIRWWDEETYTKLCYTFNWHNNK